MINAVMIGLGWWGKHSIDSVKGKSDKINIIGACARNTDQHAEYLNKNELKSYNNYDDVLKDEAVDAVILTTPHSLHTEQILSAANHNKHVFVEKPMTLTKDDAINCVNALKEKNLKLGVGFSRRFQPAYIDLLKMVKAGDIGEVLHIEGEQSGPSAYKLKEGMWRAQKLESPGGAMAARGIHVMDAMISIAGEVDRISCISERRVLDIDLDDTTSMLVKFKSGVSGYLGTIYVTADIWRLHVYGSKGYMLMDGETRLIKKSLDNTETITNYPNANIVGLTLEAFADDIEGKQSFPVTPEEAIQGVAAFEAMVKSAQNDYEWIKLD
jgi:predicted dehydrogenase